MDLERKLSLERKIKEVSHNLRIVIDEEMVVEIREIVIAKQDEDVKNDIVGYSTEFLVKTCLTTIKNQHLKDFGL